MDDLVQGQGSDAATGAVIEIALDKAHKSGASWLFIIAGLSVVNVVMAVSGSDTMFVVGLGAIQFLAAIASAPTDDTAQNALMVVRGLCWALSMVIIGMYVGIGLLARARHRWAYVTGMILYGLDGLIVLLFGIWMCVFFHAFALYWIFRGFKACGQLNELKLSPAAGGAYGQLEMTQPVATAVRTANNINKVVESAFQPQHEYVEVELRDFDSGSVGYYDQARMRFEALGYRHIFDIEDRTLSAATKGTHKPMAVRVMLSSDGTAVAAIARFRPTLSVLLISILGGRYRWRFVELETELSDGTFIQTSNTLGSNKMTPAPEFIRQQYPSATSIEVLHARHSAKVLNHCQGHAGIWPVKLSSKQDILDSQHRVNAITAGFRKSLGGVTAGELKSMAARE
jgi:hypothetical protein